MSDVAILVLLYGLGVLILVAEVFIPSHGILTVVGLGLLIAGVVQTFSYAGRDAGIIAIFACLVFVPAFAILAIKYWHRTPIGKRIAPPNPTLTAADTSVPIEEINSLIGRTGRTVSPLRPVGICDFNGRRVSCVAQFGMVEAGVAIEGVGLSGTNLAVVEKKV
jgi:membrane-bound serine protease (ClpP class)